MEYPETTEQALVIAGQAMEHMVAHGIAPNPRNFTIWYGYSSDHYPDLRRHMEKVMSSKTTFSEDVNSEIFERFFTSAQETEGVANAGVKLETTLEQMLKLFTAANKGTERYNRTLEDFSDQVATTDPKALEAMVGTMVAETKRMMRVNDQLADELSQSSKEVHKLREDLDKVRHEALTDGLTGIANRKVFDNQIREQTRIATEDGTPLSLLMIDIDFFKKFNDSFGHQMGDQVLRLVAKTIQEGVRGQDITARYGGEEFSVILPETRVREAITVAETIRRHVASKRVTNRRTSQDMGTVTLSIGVSQFEPGEGISNFIQRADEALYMAKGEGRNRVVSHVEVELKRLAGQ
ncbi:MAG: diguanylate cyclase [Rhodospirillum sp.]|nr:diguanylate cyclase [Rhodospirillum sp.]MCF8488476.1 diguanylate cyclase [Rhodospirillum sp.]MCF8502380.1 diguanylate cyclase [Rhodospirillum sp.]